MTSGRFYLHSRIIFSLFPSVKTNLVPSNFLFAHFTVEHTEEPWSLTWIYVDVDDMTSITMELSVPLFGLLFANLKKRFVLETLIRMQSVVTLKQCFIIWRV